MRRRAPWVPFSGGEWAVVVLGVAAMLVLAGRGDWRALAIAVLLALAISLRFGNSGRPS